MSTPAFLPRPYGLALTLVTVSAALAACGSDLTLPPPTQPTLELTITLYALSGTPIATPSAYNLIGQNYVRTDRSNDFDFAFDIGVDSLFGVGTLGDTVAVFLPRGAMGFQADGGVQTSAVPYDSLLLAPSGGYESSKALAADSGDVVVARSRLLTCNFGFRRGLHAKFDIRGVDLAARTITFRMLLNSNCGYRGLTPGIPPN